MIKEAGMDFKHKEVINITNAKRLGYVQDVCADFESGKITSIIVPGNRRMINMFTSKYNTRLTYFHFAFFTFF